MPDWLVDALLIALTILGGLAIIDALVFYFMWRVSVYKRNLARRVKTNDIGYGLYDTVTVNDIRRMRGLPPSPLISSDSWFSEASQKELYRDFSV